MQASRIAHQARSTASSAIRNALARAVVRTAEPKFGLRSFQRRDYADARQNPGSLNRYLTPALCVVVVAGAAGWALSSPAPAKTSKIKAQVPDTSPSKPAFTRDDVTVTVIIGGPSTGTTAHAKRIARHFDMQYEDADSSDIALNIPTAKQGQSHNGKLRLIIDDFPSPSASPSDDALDRMRWFESHVAPICVVVFVDCPPDEAEKRSKGAGEKMKQWKDHIAPVVDHYREKGNILEITGEWPADEQWQQIEAKLESALELESRGEL